MDIESFVFDLGPYPFAYNLGLYIVLWRGRGVDGELWFQIHGGNRVKSINIVYVSAAIKLESVKLVRASVCAMSH